MNTKVEPATVAVVAGEESGDILGADLVDAINSITGHQSKLIGVGGGRLKELGLNSLFDADEIAIMGIGAVLRDLPRLISRISSTARAIAKAKPDCLVLIDSPAFNLRVAKKVRRLDPDIPIIKYVCPSIWAWNPGRAPKMRQYIDHVLCLLPFEPAELERLGGPQGTYIGHRLTHDPRLQKAAEAQKSRRGGDAGKTRELLVLPGSRRSEVARLMDDFGETVSQLAKRGNEFRLVLPTVPRLASLVETKARSWHVKPEIVVGEDAKWEAYSSADAALAASGTVLLELALAGVPSISTYRFDRFLRMIFWLITVWSGALPNLIADRVVIPEYYDHFIRPGLLARALERLMGDTPERRAQLDGFADVARRMHTELPAGRASANIILAEIQKRRQE
jgi:lipid-A-disaccharide synthase